MCVCVCVCVLGGLPTGILNRRHKSGDLAWKKLCPLGEFASFLYQDS